jgi:hypothetical protein
VPTAVVAVEVSIGEEVVVDADVRRGLGRESPARAA